MNVPKSRRFDGVKGSSSLSGTYLRGVRRFVLVTGMSLSGVLELYTTKARLFCPASTSIISASLKLGGVLFASVLLGRKFVKKAMVS